MRPFVQREMALEGLRVSHALIVAPKVSFRVYGENVVLCHLVDMFGVRGVEQLLEENAIEFVLWRGHVLEWANPMPGLLPLAPFTATNPEHSDPQTSVETGLRKWGNKGWPAVTRLSRLAAEHTIIPAKTLPQTAVSSVYSAYRAGALVPDGLDPSVSLESLPATSRTALALLAERVFEGLLLFENDYDLHEAAESWEALVKVCSKFSTDERIPRAVEQVLELEGLPSIPQLVLTNVISFGDVVRLRSHAATIEFRRWLWSQPDPRDAAAVARAYANAITGRKVVEQTWFKTARITTMSVVQGAMGAGIGAVAAGTPGLVIGGAVGLATSLADAFGLEALLQGVRPRRFAEEVLRPRTALKQLPTSKEGIERSGAPRQAEIAGVRDD